MNTLAKYLSKERINFFNLKLLDDFTVIVAKSSNVVFDDRNEICCRYYCPNYKTRCFCPPYSIKKRDQIAKYQYVVIFAKTYDFSELHHFKEFPKDYNDTYLFKNRIFVRRWVQSDYYGKIKTIFKCWNITGNDFFAGGFSMGKCLKCFSANRKEGKVKNSAPCVAMPSPEALGINIAKTMENFGYHVHFGVKDRMTKIAMLFTNKDIGAYIGKKQKNDHPHDHPFLQKDIQSIIKSKMPKLKFRLIDIKEIMPKINDKFKWIEKWDQAILYDAHTKTVIERLHELVFMQNNPYALTLDTKDIGENIAESKIELIK